MKIGILTQPLYCNYGGLVQCYALQQTLQRMGHEAIVLQREWNRKYTLKGACVFAEKFINIKLEFVILHFFRMLTLSHESYSLSLKKHKKGIENFISCLPTLPCVRSCLNLSDIICYPPF